MTYVAQITLTNQSAVKIETLGAQTGQAKATVIGRMWVSLPRTATSLVINAIECTNMERYFVDNLSWCMVFPIGCQIYIWLWTSWEHYVCMYKSGGVFSSYLIPSLIT